jgi:hypothetical protein
VASKNGNGKKTLRPIPPMAAARMVTPIKVAVKKAAQAQAAKAVREIAIATREGLKTIAARSIKEQIIFNMGKEPLAITRELARQLEIDLTFVRTGQTVDVVSGFLAPGATTIGEVGLPRDVIAAGLGERTVPRIPGQPYRVINPWDHSRLAKEVTGLDYRRINTVLNYRAQLIDDGLEMTKVDRKVMSFIKKKRLERARVIARNETMRALNNGHQRAMRDAQRRGILSKKAVKVLDVVLDSDTCPVCSPLYGQKRRINKPFNTRLGSFMNPPFHVNCRCTMHIEKPRMSLFSMMLGPAALSVASSGKE